MCVGHEWDQAKLGSISETGVQERLGNDTEANRRERILGRKCVSLFYWPGD